MIIEEIYIPLSSYIKLAKEVSAYHAFNYVQLRSSPADQRYGKLPGFGH